MHVLERACTHTCTHAHTHTHTHTTHQTHTYTCTYTHTHTTLTHTPHSHTQNDKLSCPLPLAYSPITKAFHAVCPLACVISRTPILSSPLQAISWFTNLICSLYLPLYTLYAACTTSLSLATYTPSPSVTPTLPPQPPAAYTFHPLPSPPPPIPPSPITAVLPTHLDVWHHLPWICFTSLTAYKS